MVIHGTILYNNMTEIILEFIQKPFVQVLFFILLTLLSIFIIGPKTADKTWTIAGVVFIGFMMVNAVFICTAYNSWSYFFYSVGFSVVYLLSIAVIVPALIKLLKIEGSAESAMIFIFIIYHPLSLLLMVFLKWAYLKLF